MLNRINPPGLAAAAGFSHAVSATGGTVVFLAGQTALDADGRIVGDDVVSQFEQALGNLLAALAAAGGAPSDLAKMTIYSVDPANYKANAKGIGAVWQRLVGRDYPALALVGVTRLWDDAALVEVDGIAVIGQAERHH
jgi:enamine deaminase RidA (YjgF/YER057c/UK114 family)